MFNLHKKLDITSENKSGNTNIGLLMQTEYSTHSGLFHATSVMWHMTIKTSYSLSILIGTAPTVLLKKQSSLEIFYNHSNDIKNLSKKLSFAYFL